MKGLCGEKCSQKQPLALRYRLGIVSLVTALDSASNHDDKHIQSTNQTNQIWSMLSLNGEVLGKALGETW